MKYYLESIGVEISVDRNGRAYAHILRDLEDSYLRDVCHAINHVENSMEDARVILENYGYDVEELY